MPLPSSGSLKSSEIQTEFTGTNPISLSEYYRGSVLVPGGAQNSGIPTAGTISISNFRSSSRTVLVTYAIIGAAGAGGYGLENGGDNVGANGSRGRGGSGLSSTITGPSININAAGGIGGRNAGGSGDGDPEGFRDGQASFYGPGGAATPNGQNGNPAPTTSYGAAGGGAGGDQSSYSDESGSTGEGGFAGTRVTGSVTVPYGASLSINIGDGGTPSTEGVYTGGAGARGFCSLVFDGKTVNFTNSTTYVVL